MLEFKKITSAEKEIFDSFYQHKTIQNCETAFANLCAWSFLYRGEYAIINGSLITRVHYEYNKIICYHCPIGTADKIELLDILIKDSIENNYLLKVIVDCKEVFDGYFDGQFSFEDKREFYDYLYSRESLATLSGKHLQPKRNHCNKFEKSYNYEYININLENIQECVIFAEKWLENTIKEKDLSCEEQAEECEGYKNELKVINYFVDNFDILNMIGGIIRVEDKIVAFTMGSKISNDTFCTHIEKADKNYDGAYNIINREFARNLPSQYEYINREEDLGLEGLRKAKLSYQPVKLIEKQIATLKR